MSQFCMLYVLQAGNRLDNPPSGTVADHTITRRDRYTLTFSIIE